MIKQCYIKWLRPHCNVKLWCQNLVISWSNDRGSCLCSLWHCCWTCAPSLNTYIVPALGLSWVGTNFSQTSGNCLCTGRCRVDEKRSILTSGVYFFFLMIGHSLTVLSFGCIASPSSYFFIWSWFASRLMPLFCERLLLYIMPIVYGITKLELLYMYTNNLTKERTNPKYFYWSFPLQCESACIGCSCKMTVWKLDFFTGQGKYW